jgi:hypothetical protein
MDAEERKELENAFDAFRQLVKEGHKRITLEWSSLGAIVCTSSMREVKGSEVDLITTDEGAKMKWVPKSNTAGVHSLPMVKHPKRKRL